MCVRWKATTIKNETIHMEHPYGLFDTVIIFTHTLLPHRHIFRHNFNYATASLDNILNIFIFFFTLDRSPSFPWKLFLSVFIQRKITNPHWADNIKYNCWAWIERICNVIQALASSFSFSKNGILYSKPNNKVCVLNFNAIFGLHLTIIKYFKCSKCPFSK